MSVRDFNIFLRIYNNKHNCNFKMDIFKDIMGDYLYSSNDYNDEIENCNIKANGEDEFVQLGYIYIVGKLGKFPKNLTRPFVEKVLCNSGAEEQIEMLKGHKYNKYFKSLIGKEFDDIMKEIKKIYDEEII